MSCTLRTFHHLFVLLFLILDIIPEQIHGTNFSQKKKNLCSYHSHHIMSSMARKGKVIINVDLSRNMHISARWTFDCGFGFALIEQKVKALWVDRPSG